MQYLTIYITLRRLMNKRSKHPRRRTRGLVVLLVVAAAAVVLVVCGA